MALITLFSATKPFTDPFIATIQRNAIQSWTRLGWEVEVMLVGDESGSKEIADEFNLRYLPQVERNQWGTPLVRSLFEQVRQASDSPIMAIVNADILIMSDFVEAIKQVAAQADRFLVVGRRWGLDIDRGLDFSPGWQERLRADVHTHGQLHPTFSIDYFIFTRHQYQDMPDFVIGRPQWDNWMIYHACQEGWPVIDATPTVLVVHQNHDYRHLPGGKPPHGLEEGRRNRALAGGQKTKYLILDAEYELVDGRLRRPKLTFEGVLRRFEVWLMRQSWRGIELRVLKVARRVRKAVGEPLPEGWMAGGLKRDQNAQKTHWKVKR